MRGGYNVYPVEVEACSRPIPASRRSRSCRAPTTSWARSASPSSCRATAAAADARRAARVRRRPPRRVQAARGAGRRRRAAAHRDGEGRPAGARPSSYDSTSGSMELEFTARSGRAARLDPRGAREGEPGRRRRARDAVVPANRRPSGRLWDDDGRARLARAHDPGGARRHRPRHARSRHPRRGARPGDRTRAAARRPSAGSSLLREAEGGGPWLAKVASGQVSGTAAFDEHQVLCAARWT